MDIKQSKDVCIENLTSTEGVKLEITANLTSQNQITAVLQGYIAKRLNSAYGVDRYQVLLRMTDSWHGRCRDDLTGIGKVADIQGWNIGGHEQ